MQETIAFKQSTVPGPEATASPGKLSNMQIPYPTPDVTDQKLLGGAHKSVF